jgi:hypothetical protein
MKEISTKQTIKLNHQSLQHGMIKLKKKIQYLKKKKIQGLRKMKTLCKSMMFSLRSHCKTQIFLKLSPYQDDKSFV